jgi:hypothetical protein
MLNIKIKTTKILTPYKCNSRTSWYPGPSGINDTLLHADRQNEVRLNCADIESTIGVFHWFNLASVSF